MDSSQRQKITLLLWQNTKRPFVQAMNSSFSPLNDGTAVCLSAKWNEGCRLKAPPNSPPESVSHSPAPPGWFGWSLAGPTATETSSRLSPVGPYLREASSSKVVSLSAVVPRAASTAEAHSRSFSPSWAIPYISAALSTAGRRSVVVPHERGHHISHGMHH